MHANLLARWTASLAILSLLALPASVRADEHEAEEATTDAAAVPEADVQERQQPLAATERDAVDHPTMELKVFELQHRTPHEISQLLQFHTGHRVAFGERSRAAETGRTGLDSGGAVHGPPGAAGAPRQAGFRGPQQVRIVAIHEGDQQMLFVRGPEDQIEKVGELIEAFDMPVAELEQKSFNGAHFFPVSEDKLTQVHSILSQLQIRSQMVKLEDGGLIVIQERDDERLVEQAEQVIAKLTQVDDVEDVAIEVDEDGDAENEEQGDE